MRAAGLRPCSVCGQNGKEGATGKGLYDHRRQLCKRCYVRAHEQGTLPPMPTLVDLFTLWRVIDDHGCWLWQGAIGSHGYGRWNQDYVHRLSYEHHIGPIQDGLVIDHLCRVHACFNPEHLEPVTNRENSLRGEHPKVVRARMLVCQRGHAMTPDNVYNPPGRTERWCRECCRLRKRAAWRDRHILVSS